MTEWLENVYTWFSRLGDYLSYIFDYIETGVKYVFDSASALFSVSLTSELTTVIFLAIAVCVILFVLGR